MNSRWLKGIGKREDDDDCVTPASEVKYFRGKVVVVVVVVVVVGIDVEEMRKEG